MSMIWIICGAGRGVGKTEVARRLCEALPSSIYAKLGHGKPKPGKPGHFFRDLGELRSFLESCRNSAKHVIVESNALARRREGDLTVFIDGVDGKTAVRRDRRQLKEAADLSICADAPAEGWRKTLDRKLGRGSLSRRVCGILANQKRHLFGPKLEVRTKLWFVQGDAHVFGLGLDRLLTGVERWGSLREAARGAKMSYRRAWDLLVAAEKHLGKPLVLRQAGGRGGGSSTLSVEGHRLLNVFRRLNVEIAAFADERFPALYEEITDARG